MQYPEAPFRVGPVEVDFGRGRGVDDRRALHDRCAGDGLRLVAEPDRRVQRVLVIGEHDHGRAGALVGEMDTGHRVGRRDGVGTGRERAALPGEQLELAAGHRGQRPVLRVDHLQHSLGADQGLVRVGHGALPLPAGTVLANKQKVPVRIDAHGHRLVRQRDVRHRQIDRHRKLVRSRPGSARAQAGVVGMSAVLVEGVARVRPVLGRHYLLGRLAGRQRQQIPSRLGILIRGDVDQTASRHHGQGGPHPVRSPGHRQRIRANGIDQNLVREDVVLAHAAVIRDAVRPLRDHRLRWRLHAGRSLTWETWGVHPDPRRPGARPA